ncbi:uncharacterized protein EV154DRAFT_581099 [Mucor mucedo]|uniref:uncharacterized protein n=1 Tax=Mucor mucedo TaxID=29922 RepID=UPI00221F5069|nr:uncharacterized protein EV154DRAFT_581099 [Mucor mucedo]KAI7870899.1 hypothetical protein EV154DRAFT_581099 [Mucor mucedo]
MGIYTTSHVEAAHSALKGNNRQISKCSLATTFVQLDMVLANQNIKAVMGKGYSKFSADPFVLTNPMFRELVKVVSRFAIEKIREQIQMFKKEISDRSLRPCTGVFSTVMKLPCRHIIYKEEYDQLFSSQTNKVYTKTNATDTILHKLRQAIEEIPFEHVRKEKLDVISQMVDNINANLDVKVLQPLKKKELVISSQKIAKTGRILSQGEADEAKVKKVNKRKPSTTKTLKQATFDGSTIIDDNIKPFVGLFSVCMPEFMLKHVASVTKVLGDGNCGFRSVAASVGKDEVKRIALSLGVELSGNFEKDEDYCMDVRNCLLKQLTNNASYYISCFFAGSISEYQTLLESISLPVMGECEKDKWMIMGATGYLIADVYSRPVYFFSKKESITILPNCILNENKPNPQQQKQQQTQQQKQQQTQQQTQQQKQQQTQQQKQEQTQQPDTTTDTTDTIKAPLTTTTEIISSEILCKPKRVVVPPSLIPSIEAIEAIKAINTPDQPETEFFCHKCQHLVFRINNKHTPIMDAYYKLDTLKMEYIQKKLYAEGNKYSRNFKKFNGQSKKIHNIYEPKLREFCKLHTIEEQRPLIVKYFCESFTFESLANLTKNLVKNGAIDRLLSGAVRSQFEYSKSDIEAAGGPAKYKLLNLFYANKHRIMPGYYGQIGFEIISKAAIYKFSHEAYKGSSAQKKTGLSHQQYLTTVIVPEIACWITAEDQGVKYEDAILIMEQTYKVGELLHPFDFEANFLED